MRIKDPALLSLFIVFIPILIIYFKKNRISRATYSSVEILQKIKKRQSDLLIHIPFILRCFALCLMIIALARPQIGVKDSEIPSEGIDIMLALDSSGSMKAMDFIANGNRVDRLQAVKNVVSQFIEKRPTDRIGMVVFGDEAFTQCPLTLDHDITLKLLDNVTIGMAGNNTAIGAAIAIGVKRLKDLKAKSKIIILLTDGRNNAGRITPQAAAKAAASLGIKIYTIGIGSKGEAPVPIETPFGIQYVYQKVDLDEATLQDIAKTTGAHYYRATDTKKLQSIYRQIDSLEKTEIKMKQYMEYYELYPYFLSLGLLLLLFEITLANTRLLRLP